jgi:hypothetical protein
VFNFAEKSFCGSFFFLLRIFFSRTKTFIDIDLYSNLTLQIIRWKIKQRAMSRAW